MTRKHYTALARKLHDCRPQPSFGPESTLSYDGWWEAVCAVADVCESDNDRFDRDRFIGACERGV